MRALAPYIDHPGSVFITGNHERPLEDWAIGADVRKKAFLQTALPSFEREGYTQENARDFLSRTVDGAILHWRGLDVLATHGGFSDPPQQMGLLSAEHLHHGTGSPTFDVDTAWEDGVLRGDIPPPSRLLQVHGHRNHRARPILAGKGSVNLEGGVEEGGEMRALVLSKGADGVVKNALMQPCLDKVT